MKVFLKKNLVALLWVAAALLWIYHDAAMAGRQPTPFEFTRQFLAYAIGALAFLVALVVLTIAWKALQRLWVALKNAPTPGDLEAEEDAHYAAACAWRAINLAIGNPNHNEACSELADLRDAGWFIEKSGNERAGWVYLKLIAPGKQAQGEKS
jgi:hypothetical protein